MTWLRQHWPLLLMYPLIFGLLSGPPILVSWLGKILNWVPSDLQEYRLRWVVVTKETLCPGDRVTKDQAELQLQYLATGELNNGKPPMETAAQTLASVHNQYALSELYKDKPLTKNTLGPSPKLHPAPNNLIVPVSVRREYSQGLRPAMQLWFGHAGAESAKIQVPQSMPVGLKGNNMTESTSSKQQSKPTPVDIGKSKSKEKSPVVVSLRAITPSADNKHALLYVEVPNADSDRLSELTLGNLVPVVLPSSQDCTVENIRAAQSVRR